MKYEIGIGTQMFSVEIGEIQGGVAQVAVNGLPYEVTIANWSEASAQTCPRPVAVAAPATPAVKSAPARKAPAPAGGAVITAPIPGLILDLKVRTGDPVTTGQVVATMEAMKMENALTSMVDGTVKEIRVEKGAEVATGDVIMIIG